MIKHKALAGITSTALVLMLAACSDTSEEAGMEENVHEEMDMETPSSEDMGMSEGTHEGMDHSGSGKVPAGLQPAVNPTFEVGSKVLIEADHMEGMQGMEATVSGAYDTTVYSISYTPEDGHPVEDHKWVIHEELADPGAEPLEPGTEVVVNADHMDGMAGVTATIDTAAETTVYTIDFMMASGEEVVNHMWVTEDELSPE